MYFMAVCQKKMVQKMEYLPSFCKCFKPCPGQPIFLPAPADNLVALQRLGIFSLSKAWQPAFCFRNTNGAFVTLPDNMAFYAEQTRNFQSDFISTSGLTDQAVIGVITSLHCCVGSVWRLASGSGHVTKGSSVELD